MFKKIVLFVLISALHTLASPEKKPANKKGPVAKHPCLILSQKMASHWSKIIGLDQVEGLQMNSTESVLPDRVRKYDITFHAGSVALAKAEIETYFSDEQYVCYFTSMRPSGPVNLPTAKPACDSLAQQMAAALAKTSGNDTLGGFNMKTSETALSPTTRQYNVIFQMGSAEIERTEIVTEYSEELKSCQLTSMRMH